MKNRLQLLKSHLKKLNLTHVLLMVLILVVFLGLFKKEVNSFKSAVMDKMPSIVNGAHYVEEPCKIDVVNPKWTEEANVKIEKCLQSSAKGIGEFHSKALNDFYCSLHPEGDINTPHYFKKDSICKVAVPEKQFWAFGIHWFNVGQ